MTTPKITAEVMAKFCAKDDFTEALNHPFLMNGQILASNRHIAIRMDQAATEVLGLFSSRVNTAQKIWDLIELTKAKGRPLGALPPLNSPIPCNFCQGAGKIQHPSGLVKRCESCNGLGEVNFTYEKAGPGAYIATRYLRLIASLPNALLAPEVEAGERMSVRAFQEGWADRGQFNILADCRDLLTLAASHKNDQGTLAVARAAGFALANIKDRYLSTQKMGCTGEEMKALTVLVDVSQDFWRRQSGNLFAAANRSLDKARGFKEQP